MVLLQSWKLHENSVDFPLPLWARKRTWCSSAKRENFDHIPQILTNNTASLMYILSIPIVVLTKIVKLYTRMLRNTKLALRARTQVLRADTNVLYDRLKKRGYNDRKVNENMECEIMQVVLEEARESYAEDIVKEIKSNSIEELEKNVESVATWAKQWTLAKSSS